MTMLMPPEDRVFINGEWRAVAGGGQIPVINPATEEVIGSIAEAGPSDLDAAVEAARAALDGPWGKMSARERGAHGRTRSPKNLPAFSSPVFSFRATFVPTAMFNGR